MFDIVTDLEQRDRNEVTKEMGVGSLLTRVVELRDLANTRDTFYSLNSVIKILQGRSSPCKRAA